MADNDNTLILETTKGTVTIEMRPDLAPGHVARIKELVREGFYDGIVFHRVIDGFMAQTGCPQGTGTGGSGKKLKAEFNKEPHVRGTTSMARAASPDSGDSQFFICFDDASFLNNQYTVWGKVTSGMENVDKIKRGEPVKDPDKIIKAQDGCGRGLTVIASHGPGFAGPMTGSTKQSRAPGSDWIASSQVLLAMTAHQHAHRSLRLRTSRRQHRAAAGQPARFRADAGGTAGRSAG